MLFLNCKKKKKKKKKKKVFYGDGPHTSEADSITFIQLQRKSTQQIIGLISYFFFIIIYNYTFIQLQRKSTQQIIGFHNFFLVFFNNYL